MFFLPSPHISDGVVGVRKKKRRKEKKGIIIGLAGTKKGGKWGEKRSGKVDEGGGGGCGAGGMRFKER